MRCGLASAVERDVTASKERTPLDRLQPASLVPHYKFSAKASHVTDAAGDHVPLVGHLSTHLPNSYVIIRSYLNSNHCRDMCDEQRASKIDCLADLSADYLKHFLSKDHHLQAFFLLGSFN